MTTLTVAGHSVTVSDDFLKLSPEEQHTAVDEIAKSLPAERSSEPSGVVAGFQHGIADAVRGDASTIGLTGATTPAMDAAANTADPKNYKAATLIKEGGHWYNPSDYQTSALPQILAEQAPGLAQDMSVGYGAGKLVPGSPAVKALAATGGFAGSALLRTFGPGAHANADARTGVPNSPVETKDITREAAKQAVELPLNMVGAGRVLPGGGKLAGSALEKYLKTVAIETGTGAATDLADQAATTAGSKDGLNIDLNRTAQTALSRAAGSSVLVAPRLAAEASANAKYGKIEADPDAQAAAQALAKRQLLIADGRSLVGPLGGTKVAAEAVNGAHADVHSELADATKGEDLNQDNTNTLDRINSGAKVAPSEVKALAAEASPDTMHLARQAMISKQLRDSGNISDNGFTGGLSGAMDNLAPIKAPIKTAGLTAAAAIGGHAAGLGTLGAMAPAVVGGVGGAYLLAHGFDKLAGTRSPAQGFTDRFGGTDTPVRLDAPTAPMPEPATTSVPQVSPPQDTALWGNPAAPVPNLRPTLNANVKIEEGMAKIAKQIAAQKKQSMIASAIPMLQQLAARQQAPVTTDVPAQAPAISPIALKMTQARMKAGLPPDPVAKPPAAPEPPQAPVISPIAQKMLQQKLKQGLPPAPAEAPPGVVSDAPASPAISALMQKLQAPPVAPVQAAPPTSMSDILQRAQAPTPQPPVIAKITKKMNKPVEATPAPEAEQPYTPIPPEALWRKPLSDEDVAQKELASYGPKAVQKYSKNVIANREAKRDFAETIANDHTPADAAASAALYDQLDHISRRTEARKAIKHYAKFMSAVASKAVHAHFTDNVLKGMWHSE